jgi:2-methylisocitrate lyase-like PEP mutase family enzyme
VSAAAQRAAVFRALHAGPPFVIPNPWDVGSARVLEALGFPALATTSSGFAFTLGRKDGGARLPEVLAHVAALAAATRVPISVDLEHGHGPSASDVAVTITRVANAGASGGSIEDYDPVDRELYPLDVAVERVAAAVAAARALPHDFVVTARAENFIRDNPDLDDTIARLVAFEEVGADVLYAPGLRTLDQIRAVRAATTRPLNVLARADLTLEQLAEAGVQRVSVGGALTWVAAGAMVGAARQMLAGDFAGLVAPERADRLID